MVAALATHVPPAPTRGAARLAARPRTHRGCRHGGGARTAARRARRASPPGGSSSLSRQWPAARAGGPDPDGRRERLAGAFRRAPPRSRWRPLAGSGRGGRGGGAGARCLGGRRGGQFRPDVGCHARSAPRWSSACLLIPAMVARRPRARAPEVRLTWPVWLFVGRPRRRIRRAALAGGDWVVVAVLGSLFALLVGRLGHVQLDPRTSVCTRPSRSHDTSRDGARHTGRDPRPHGRPLVTNRHTTTVTVPRSVLLDAPDGGRALVAAVAEGAGRPFDELWGKTMLCGTSGAPPAPACFNGSPYVPIPLATAVDPRMHSACSSVPRRYAGIGVVAEPTRDHPLAAPCRRLTCSATWRRAKRR